VVRYDPGHIENCVDISRASEIHRSILNFESPRPFQTKLLLSPVTKPQQLNSGKF
jgi:hypothetical protein